MPRFFSTDIISQVLISCLQPIFMTQYFHFHKFCFLVSTPITFRFLSFLRKLKFFLKEHEVYIDLALS